jgi:hypothetical protein
MTLNNTNDPYNPPNNPNKPNKPNPNYPNNPKFRTFALSPGISQVDNASTILQLPVSE